MLEEKRCESTALSIYGTFPDSDTQWLRLQTIEGSIVGRKVSYSWCCSSSVLVRIAAIAVFAIAVFGAITLLNECRGVSGSKFFCYTYIGAIEFLVFTCLGTFFGAIITVMEEKESPVEIRNGDSSLDEDSSEEITYSVEESSDPSSDEGSTIDEAGEREIVHLEAVIIK